MEDKKKLPEAAEDAALDLNDLSTVAGGNMQDESVTNDTTPVSGDTENNA